MRNASTRTCCGGQSSKIRRSREPACSLLCSACAESLRSSTWPIFKQELNWIGRLTAVSYRMACFSLICNAFITSQPSPAGSARVLQHEPYVQLLLLNSRYRKCTSSFSSAPQQAQCSRCCQPQNGNKMHRGAAFRSKFKQPPAPVPAPTKQQRDALPIPMQSEAHATMVHKPR